MSTLAPVERSTAVAQSRSQFEPGKTTTEALIALLSWTRTCCAFRLSHLHPEALDHGVGQQLLGHGLGFRLGLGPVASGHLELDGLAHPHVRHVAPAEPV